MSKGNEVHVDDDIPEFVPPLRFGNVNQNLHRGSYPNLRNFRFLLRLKLKCILSLIPEPPSADLMMFASIFNVKLVHIPITRTAALSTLSKRLISFTLYICNTSHAFKPHILVCLRL